MKKEMEHLVIDRRFWDRGRSNKSGDNIPPTCLIGTEGMCCLGYYGILKGISPEQMLGVGDPEIFAYREGPFKKDFFGGVLHYTGDSSFAITVVGDDLVTDNDKNLSDGFTEFDREESIANLFLKIGVEVEFIN